MAVHYAAMPMALTPARRRLAWVVVLAMAAGHLVFAADLLRVTFAGYGDYSAFYTAGKLVWQDRTALYDLHRQAEMRAQLFPAVRLHSASLPFYHPAYEALPFAFLALMPYAAAWSCWAALNVLMLALTVHLLRRTFALEIPHSALLLLAWSYFPVAEGLLHGQDAILLLIIYASAIAALSRRRDLLAGLTLSSGLFKFHLVVPFVVIMLFRRVEPIRRWRLITGFAVGGTALAALSVAVTGWHGAVQFFALLWHFDRIPARVTGNLDLQMPSLGGFLSTVLAHGEPARGTRLLIFFSFVLVIAIGAAIVRRARDAGLELTACVALTSTLLAGYHVNAHDLALLFIPLLVLSRSVARQRAADAATAAVLALLWFSPVYLLLMQRQALTALFWPMLGLLIVLVRDMKANPSTAPALAKHTEQQAESGVIRQ